MKTKVIGGVAVVDYDNEPEEDDDVTDEEVAAFAKVAAERAAAAAAVRAEREALKQQELPTVVNEGVGVTVEEVIETAVGDKHVSIHTNKTYKELQDTFEYQPYRLFRNVPRNAKREVLIAELDRIDAKPQEQKDMALGVPKKNDEPVTEEEGVGMSDEETIETAVDTSAPACALDTSKANEVLQMNTTTTQFQLQDMSYRQLQTLAKDLREEGYFEGRVNAKRQALESVLERALASKNTALRERNERAVFGNQPPRHQAGSRANLMTRSKAREARLDVPKKGNHNKLNKEFYKRQAELGIGVGVTDTKKASEAFSYKQMRLDLTLTTNGCVP